MADAVFEIYTNDPSQGGKKIGKAKLDDQGNFYGAYVIPHMFKTVHIKSLSLGMPSMDVPVENGRISSLMAHGSASGKSGQTIFPGASSVANAVYTYMGSYNTDVVPNYLTTPDVVTAAFMSDINASLPEFQSVPSNRPHYIATANQSEIMIHDCGDV